MSANFRYSIILIVFGVIIAKIENSSSTVLRTSGTTNKSMRNGTGNIIEIPQGQIQGYILQSRLGRDYHAFYKVPYAKKPLGLLRFKDPEPVESNEWSRVRNETEVAPQCIQKSKYSPIIEAAGEEDCLYANVYTPKLPNNETEVRMPTMVYIHGGGLIDGNGSRYGGKYFMDEDVVLITFQYRLGPFGFINTGDNNAKGNMGFKDQVMALKWVKKNVEYFGGDPNRITIFGNSAGGVSVSLHMISPMSSGHFNYSISQSGHAFLMVDKNPERTVEKLGEEVGCFNRTSPDFIDCMRNISAADLAVVRAPEINYALTIDAEIVTNDLSSVFMPEEPYELMRKGEVNKVNWMIGINSEEMVAQAAVILVTPEMLNPLNVNWTAAAPEMFSYGIPGENSDIMSLKIKEYFFPDHLVTIRTFQNLSALSSDRGMVHGHKVSADFQALHSDVYLYYLSKRPAKSYSDGALIGFPPGDYGASHADELQYLFLYYGYPEYSPGSEYFEFSRMLVKTWATFAATGNPNSETTMNDWERVIPGEYPISWYELNDQTKPTQILQSRMDFWDQFSPQELRFL